VSAAVGAYDLWGRVFVLNFRQAYFSGAEVLSLLRQQGFVYRTLRSFCLFLLFFLAPLASPVCIDIIWIQKSPSADPMFPVDDNGKVAYIDQSGKIVARTEFRQGFLSGEFHNGLLLWTDYPHASFIDSQGKAVRFPNVDKALDFSEGLAPALDMASQEWGYINTEGDFAIPPTFKKGPGVFVGPFSDGLALILIDPKSGFIDRTGAIVIPVQLLWAHPFREGFARVIIEGPCVSHESSCSFVGPVVLPTATKTQTPVHDCKYAFIDHSGRPISEQRFDDAKDFSEELAPVKIDGKWGFVDKTGALVVKPQFDTAESFSDGLALISLNGSFGFISHDGKYAIEPQFKYAEHFVEGLALVGDGPPGWDISSKYRYVDHAGRQAIPDSFPLATSFFKGLAHVRLPDANGKNPTNLWEGKFAYIDRTGKKVFTY
jgi:WG containing repeat